MVAFSALLSPSLADALMTEKLFDEHEKVDLIADELTYDQNQNIVSAIGSVELVQAGRILRADEISYDIDQDKISAIGNVVLNETTGEVIFADEVQLENQMKDGFVKSIKATLTDGARFTAVDGRRVNGVKVVMRRASYTACEVCKSDPNRVPLWQIKAAKVVHDSEQKRIFYSDARFEILGVPVFYTPYFTHPDGSIKRKSGLLIPDLGYDSTIGASYHQEYYWDLAPNRDATLGAVLYSKEAPLLLGEYRHRFKEASLQVRGGTTYSERIDDSNGEEIIVDAEMRGHIELDALWDINDKWRAGADIFAVSDDQYLNQYDLSTEDVLENKLYVERFDDRDYTSITAYSFQDLRVGDEQEDQPNILPELYSNFVGKPNSLLGGRWSMTGSALGLQREGSEQDVARVSLGAGWQRRFITQGLVTQIDLDTRGDFYETRDVDTATATDIDETVSRGFVRGNIQTSYPLKKELEKAQMVIEPIVAITSTTDVDNDDVVVNEDSQDAVVDALTLFSANRFPGYDRVEDRTHVSYGVKSGLYGHNGYNGRVFFGQSYRIDDDNPFAEGSGLSERESDFVGQVSTYLGDKLSLNYSIQLANDTLSSRRHEIDGASKIGRVQVGGRYFYAAPLEGTEFTTAREQVGSSLRYDFDNDWYVNGALQYDLSEEDDGLRQALYGFGYNGQCLDFAFVGERRLTRDSSGDSDTTFKVRLGLKNLGE